LAGFCLLLGQWLQMLWVWIWPKYSCRRGCHFITWRRMSSVPRRKLQRANNPPSSKPNVCKKLTNWATKIRLFHLLLERSQPKLRCKIGLKD
jgi:hypothetical protein